MKLTREILEKTLRIKFIGGKKEVANITRSSNLKGIKECLYALLGVSKDGTVASIAVSPEVLNTAGMTEDEAFDIAMFNTAQESVLMHISKAMELCLGDNENEANREIIQLMSAIGIPMYVVTNVYGKLGASAILNKTILKQFAKDMGVRRVIAIPASIHEFIVVPLSDGEGESEKEMLDFYKEMVREVNQTSVPTEEILADEAYIIAA